MRVDERGSCISPTRALLSTLYSIILSFFFALLPFSPAPRFKSSAPIQRGRALLALLFLPHLILPTPGFYSDELLNIILCVRYLAPAAEMQLPCRSCLLRDFSFPIGVRGVREHKKKVGNQQRTTEREGKKEEGRVASKA